MVHPGTFSIAARELSAPLGKLNDDAYQDPAVSSGPIRYSYCITCIAALERGFTIDKKRSGISWREDIGSYVTAPLDGGALSDLL